MQESRRLFKSRVAWTFLSVAGISSSLLMLCPASAHAQGGVPLWTNRYVGPANGNDGASAIAVDRSGNVFVTGSSSGPNVNTATADYATVAYSSAGAPLWTNLWDGPGNGSDSANAIAVDSNGNVFVMGRSSGDYATIAYSNAGVPLWTNRYDGPANFLDEASAIAVDSRGNVFVTGTSYNSGNPEEFDYATVAYSNAGVPLWTDRYDGLESFDLASASAIAVDSSGNVFVTGYSRNGIPGSEGSSSDYATIAYSDSGVPLWINRYNGPGNGYDAAEAIAVDASGNVFVTGRSYGSGSARGYATIKYSGAGLPLWTNRYDGGAVGPDGARAIAVDSSGNVFVMGGSYAANGLPDYVTLAYSNAGVPLWTNRYNGPANLDEYAYAMAVDNSGNVFVTGRSAAVNNIYDYATVGYSNSGVPLWTNRYNGPENLPASAAIAVDSSGNVFVTGSSWNGSNTDYVTIKYSSSVPPPRLDFQLLSNQLVLNWTNAGLNLQSAPAITGPFTNLAGATSPYSNVTTGAQRFFRLIGN